MIRFHDPIWLLSAVAAVPFALLALRWFSTMTSVRKVSAIVARSLLVAIIAGSLAGAASVRTSDEIAVVAVVDVSASVLRFAQGADIDPNSRVREGAIETARRLLAGAAEGRTNEDLLGIVAFGANAITVATPTATDPTLRSLDLEAGEGTAIADAMRTAAALIPPSAAGRILLVSDGNQTRGDALAEARRLAASGIQVDVLPVRSSVRNEVVMERLDAPPRAAEGAVTELRAVLRSTGPVSGTLRLLREGEAVDLNGSAPGTGRPVTLQAGVNVERLSVRLERTRLHRFEAVFEPDAQQAGLDTDPANNRASAFTMSPGRGSVLVLTTSGPGALDDTLRRANFDVTVAGPEAAPQSMLDLEAHDLVILDSVPVDEMDERTQELLVTAVRELGLGLVMIGGRGSFAAGGWRGSTLEPALPVHLDLPERLTVPQAAVVFVIDKSGSMASTIGGSTRTQQRVANEATALAIRSLDPGDLTGVVAFSNQPQLVLPVGENDAEAAAAAALSISSGGGTNIGPALELARAELAQVEAQQKEVILLTDGVSQDPDALPEIARVMREEGIRVTTIGVGSEADADSLSEVAGAGGGMFYQVLNPLALPRIFIKAVRLVREPMIKEERFTPVFRGGDSPVTLGAEGLLSSPPPLYGLALTRVRDEPGVTTSMFTPSAEPVLADWNFGLGRVVAFTSDAKNDWARDWLDWPGYAALWSSIARAAARPRPDPGLSLSSRVDDGRLNLRLEAQTEEGSPIDFLRVPATVYTPGGSREVTLEQSGPGVYEAQIPASESGNYIVLASPTDRGTRLPAVVGGTSVASGAELRSLRADLALLREIAAVSGGRLLEASEIRTDVLFDRSRTEPREAEAPLYSTLLLWALAVLMLDVGTRRVAWDRFRIDAPDSAEARRAKNLAAAMASDRLGRLKKREEVSEAALSDVDAKRAAADALAERRRRLREQALSSSGDKAAPIERAPKREEPSADGGPGGLLAAKRRAQKRMDEDD